MKRYGTTTMVSALVVVAGWAQMAQAQSGTWTNDASGNWSASGNWNAGIVADGSDFTATFGNFITANRTVTLDSARIIGSITASDTTHDYALAGTNTLTLERTSGTPGISVPTSRTLTISTPIAGTNGLSKVGAGTLTLSSGSNNYSGGTVINQGELTVGSGSDNLGTGAVTFTGDSIFRGGYNANSAITNDMVINSAVKAQFNAYNQFVHFSASGVLSGSGTLWITATDNGAGNVTLSNTKNTHTGVITVGNPTRAGNLFIASIADSNSAIELGATTGAGNLTFSGTATPQIFNDRQVKLTGTTGGGSIVNNGATANTVAFYKDLAVIGTGNKTLTLGGSNTGNNTFGGAITNGTGSTNGLTKADAGRWILGNTTNSYSGATTISGGTLEVSKLASGGVASSIGQSSSGAGNLSFGGGTLRYVGTGDSTARRFTQTGSATFDASGTGALILSNTNAPTYGGNPNTARALTLTGTNTDTNTLAAVIADNGSGVNTLTKDGIGAWVISGANTFTGSTTLSGGGQLILDYNTNDNSKLSDTAALVVGTTGGGTLTLSGGSHPEILGPTTTLNNGTGLWITRTSGSSTLQLNAINRPNGQAAIGFSEDSIASTDNTNVNGILGGWATVGANWAVNSSNGADGPIVGLSSYTTNVPTTGGDTTANYELTGSHTLTGDLTGNSLRLVNGADSDILNMGTVGTRILTPGAGHNAGILYVGGSDNIYTLTGAGTIRSANQNNNLNINVFTGTLAVNALLNSGTAATLKYGVGTLVIGGNNTWQGPLFVLDGTVRLTHNNAAGTTAGGITVQNGAALELANNITVGAEALAITGTGVANGGALRNVSDDNSYGGVVTIGDGGARINSDSGTLTLTNGIGTAIFKDVTIGGVGNVTVQAKAISGAGNLTKDGKGTLTMSVNNSFGGSTRVEAGTLALASGGNQRLSNSSPLIVAYGAKIDVGSGVAETVYQLYLNNIAMAVGTWGSTSSAATNKNDSFFSGSGVISVLAQGQDIGEPYVAPGMLIIVK